MNILAIGRPHIGTQVYALYYDTTAGYFLGDALGSVRQLTNAQGRITLAKAYNPYGEVTQSAGAGQTSYGYTNEYQRQGLIYLRARMYAPADGRFQTRDTWQGDYNRPGSLNRWNYVEGNPVNQVDPTGFYPLALFGVGWESGAAETAVWYSTEMHLIMQAVDKIAEAYAMAYNSYALSHTPSIQCLMEANGMPMEIAYMLLNSGGMGVKRIDPVSAFLGIHNGKVTFYKHSYAHQKEIKDKDGKVIGYEDDDTYGMGPNYYSVYIYPKGEYTVNRYGKGDESLADENYIRFITHEMGHVFDHAMEKAIGKRPGTSMIPTELATGSREAKSGFCGKKSTREEGWQWRFEDKNYEYFADMFVGWVYQCWEPVTPKSNLGQLRSDFMNKKMPEWIYNKLEGKYQR